MKKVRKVIFPLGGMGTRFFPATKVVPKEMLPVLDKPLIQYAVEEARNSGIEEYIFVIAPGKEVIQAHFNDFHTLNSTLISRSKIEEYLLVNSLIKDTENISYIYQQKPFGLGHAIWCARHLIKDESFAVILADDLIIAEQPCLTQMIDIYYRLGTNIIATVQIPYFDTSNYGILKFEEIEEMIVKINGMIEKPLPNVSPSNYAIVGRYILDPKILDFLDVQEFDLKEEIQLTDALNSLAQIQPFYGLKFKGQRFDCGSKLGMLHAQISVALSQPNIKNQVLSLIKEIASEL